MKLRGVDKTKDNYMSAYKFVFNQYKTAGTYGQQTVEIPRKLHSIITRWSKKHDNPYLLFDRNDNPLTQPKLTLKLNGIFGKRLSVSLLRHIFITDKLKDVPKLTELKEMAEGMGHSLESQMQYRKLE